MRTHRLDIANQIQTAVIVANHRTYFDAVVGLVAFHRVKRYPRVIVAAEYFEMRIIGWMLRSAGAIPLDRSDPSIFDDAARRVLAAGIPILVLPEGKLAGVMGDPTTLGEFRYGAARIAHDHDVPVFALAHVGCDDVWPRGHRFPITRPWRRPPVDLIGAAELIDTTGDVDTDTTSVETVVQDLLVEMVELRATVDP